MKKILIIAFSAVILIGLVIGGFALYKISTPEYALAATIKDVKTSGIVGLKTHLTSSAIKRVEAVEDWTEKSEISGILSEIAQNSAVSFLKSRMAEVDWTVEEILKGKKRTDVVVGFNYNNNIVGTIELTLVKEGREWKINDLKLPYFKKFFLW